MARITTYGNDSTVSLQDKLLGTDSQTSGTKNFPVESIVDFLNNSGLLDVFDGVLYNFEDYDASDTDPQGKLTVTGGNALATNFSALTQLIVSDKGKDNIDYTPYWSGLTNYRIKISQTDNKNNYGIFKITAQEEWADNDKYRKLTLTHQSGNGQITPGKNYFASIFQASIDSDLSARSVTEFGDVSSVGSGAIITSDERTIVNNSLLHSDVVDNVTSTSTDVPLSANQGKVLKELIDSINTLLTVDTEDSPALDDLREIVNYIQVNRETLNDLAISSIAGLQAALDSKVDEVSGKGLSANDFTDALLTKLNGIAAGAEVNVQSNWTQTDNTQDNFILNKPTDLTDLSTHSVEETNDVFDAGSGYIITDAERTKLTGLTTGAEANVQSDFDETDTNSDAFILNKPGIVDTDAAQSLTTGQKTQALSNLGITSTPSEINLLDGVTATTDELNILGGVIATTDEINLLDGVTATTTEINYVDGVTSAIQTQIDGKEDTITAGGLDPDRIAQDSATNGQALIWSDTNSQWEPGDVSGTVTSVAGKTGAVSLVKGDVGLGNVDNESKLTMFTSPTFTGEVNIQEFLKHTGDNDTYIRFQPDSFTTVVGNSSIFNATPTQLEISGGSADVDVKIEGSGNTNLLFADTSANKIGVNTNSPDVSLDINTTDAVQMPVGTEAQRPTGAAGMFRYNSDSGNFEGYTTEWGAIAGSGGGSGSSEGTVTIEKNVFDGSHATEPTNGTRTAFTLTSSVSNENLTQVYIDGVYQSKDNYTTSGSTITFSTPPPSDVVLEVIHIKATTGQISLQSESGNGTKTAFNIGQSIDNENNVQVYIDGVYQSKDNYSTSGSTVTFTTAPGDGTDVEFVHIKPVDVSSVSNDLFTGDGSTRVFALTDAPPSEAKTFVFIQGVYQEKSTYSLSSNNLTFTTAPPDGYTIEVTTFNKITIVDNTVNVERFTANGSTTSFTLTNAPTSSNNLDVYISGLYQEKNGYTYSKPTITFDAAPVNGAVVECKSIANVTNVVAADDDFVNFTWDSEAKTTSFTASVNNGYFVDTSSSDITVTLPSSPSIGDTVKIVDYGANAATNNITITSSNDIEDGSDDKVINYDKGAVELVYSGSTKGWLVASAANETDTALVSPRFDVDFLVVAGGGGGASSASAVSYGSGGGGAGGLRTSYGSSSGGGASAETSLSLTTNTDYTVTVGTGGSAGAAGSKGSQGGASTFSTITTVGGGGGGIQGFGSSASNGGSGGGVGINGTAGSGTSNQGFAGGSGGTGGHADAGGGGGAGGAGQAGANQTVANQTTGSAGDGGSGLNISITGTPVGYAGGGAGGITYHNYSTMPSGTHGGGSVVGETSVGGSGTDGTGGGGAGGSTSGSVNPSGGSGGSGVVILRYPNTYSIGETTNPTVLTFTTATVGSDKVTTFTAGDGTIEFTKV